jgi:hypothetical protein
MIRGVTSRRLIVRAARAAILDAALYREVRDDRRATAQAVAVVAVVAAAHGAGDVIRAVLVGDEIDSRWQTAWIFGMTGELVYWAVATLVVYAGGALVFRAPASASMVVRVLGFAAAPGVLIVPAAALSAALPPPAVLLPILLVRFFAAVLAIRVAMGLGWLRIIALLIVASAVGLAAVVAATRLLYEW